MRTAVQPENEKLVVNPRDELIQEMMALADQKLRREKEAKLQASAEYKKRHDSLKKNVYEKCFILLVKRYFKIDGDAGELKDLGARKIDELEKLIYELAKKRWRWQRILFWLPALLILPIPILLVMASEETIVEFPAHQFLRIHSWYKESFGSVSTAILEVKNKAK